MNELLPIGSVVRLAGASRSLIIMGIFQADQNDRNKIYDYLGVGYPEGYMGAGTGYLFYHKDIEEVILRGYEDEERQFMLEMLDGICETVKEVVEAENGDKGSE